MSYCNHKVVLLCKIQRVRHSEILFTACQIKVSLKRFVESTT